jgi:hypothetical protein
MAAMRRTMTRILLIFGIFVIALAVLTFFVFGGAFHQDEQHFAALTSIAKLHLTGDDLVHVQDRLFVTKTSDRNTPIITHLEGQGWAFVDQMGSALIFEQEGQRLIAEMRQYSRYYRIVEFSRPAAFQ